MCGIAGFLTLADSIDIENTVGRMTNTLSHRGPDDSGLWVDSKAGIALGHRRLSILDLSPEGRQPMISESGRYVIVFNGEIYNYRELRHQLDVPFRGHSDTEVMLASFERWGISESLERFNGMFAFALWDRFERCLYLSRDRFGEKPLYYGWQAGTFLFGSELKALRAHPAFRASVSRDSLALFFRLNYVPAPYSIYKDIFKLPPGTFLRLSARNGESLPDPMRYWSAEKAAAVGAAHPFSGSERDAADELDSLLRDAVRLRMVADVPLGAFLSGGIDSSTVVALMQAQNPSPVKTFSIGSHEAGFNEAVCARKVADSLGTDHTELYVSPEEVLPLIPRLPHLYDEPFADSSQIPTFLVSRLARRNVTVALSGDGGDEVFGGYTRYVWGRNIWNSFGSLPRFLQSVAARLLTIPSPQTWDGLFHAAHFFLPARLHQSHPGDKLQKLAAVIQAPDWKAMYSGLVSVWNDSLALVPGAAAVPTHLDSREQAFALSGISQKMMLLDAVTYLPDDILVKLDRASMAVSLESRVPFLDHRVFEFACRLPLSFRIRGGQGKWLLRHVLYRYLSRELVDRPKKGFSVPVHSWLRGPLRAWVESLIEPARLRREGYLNPEMVQRKWNGHLSGRHNWADAIWGIVMFQSWLEASSGEVCPPQYPLSKGFQPVTVAAQ